MKIKQDLISRDRYGIKCPYSMKPKGICVHNTANDAPAKNEAAYMERNNNQVSFHIAVDDEEAIQAIPFNRNAWHAGDGANGEGNRNYIAVEICYSLSGGEKFDKAEKNAAKLVANILRKYGWGIDRVKKHQDFSGKYCPHRTLDRGWKRFLNMVEKELNPNVGLYRVRKSWDDVKSQLGAFQEIDNAITLAKKNKGYKVYDEDGNVINGEPKVEEPKTEKPKNKANLQVDGYWGSETTKALQRHFGTIVDGVISKPSMVIKAIQKRVGAKVDGYLGPETITKMQKHLGTIVDGKISRPSMMVKEMQRRLNKGKL